MTYSKLGDAYIYVVFKGGKVKKYLTEEKAVLDINLNDGAASNIEAVIIGNELGMTTSTVEQLHCFRRKKKGEHRI